MWAAHVHKSAQSNYSAWFPGRCKRGAVVTPMSRAVLVRPAVATLQGASAAVTNGRFHYVVGPGHGGLNLVSV